MKNIILSKGQVAKVSDIDFKELNKYKWKAGIKRGNYYAYRYYRGYKLYMARVVLGLTKWNELQCDHKDHDTLNNMRSNLRAVTKAENSLNRKKYINNRSGFIGVSKIGDSNKYLAQITTNGKTISKTFYSIILAARWYDQQAKITRKVCVINDI